MIGYKLLYLRVRSAIATILMLHSPEDYRYLELHPEEQEEFDKQVTILAQTYLNNYLNECADKGIPPDNITAIEVLAKRLTDGAIDEETAYMKLMELVAGNEPTTQD